MGKDIPDNVKLLVFEGSDFQCVFCGYREGLNITVHHIIPKVENGEDTYDNLITLCHNKVQMVNKISDKEILKIRKKTI